MKKIILLMFAVFCIASISAECNLNDGCIGTSKIKTNIELYQTCNNCTFCNFTQVKYPNGTNILASAIAIQDNTYFNFSVDRGNITALGAYTYCYHCGNTIESLTGCLWFEVTTFGDSLDTRKSIIYVILFGGVLSIFLLCLWGAVVTPYSNQRNELNRLVSVEKLKYLKLVLIFMSYLLLVWLVNLLISLSNNYLLLTQYNGFFTMIFTLLTAMTYPMFVVMFITFIFVGWKDLQLNKLLTRGLMPR